MVLFKKINFALAILMLLQFGSLHAAGKTGLETERLTCEYIVNPLGIEVLKPRLSWTMVSSIRNQQQTAYELIVSDNLADIKRRKGSVWSTGKIASSQSVHVAYDGSPLKAFTRYYWRVKVYGNNGASSGWSEPQWFETAMLKASDWQGKWIGDGSKQFEKDEDFYKNDPMPLLRKTINAEKKITAARLYISGLGYYEAFVNGKKVGDHVLDPGWTSYSKQVLYSVYDITPHMKKGLNAAGIMLGNGWYNPLPLRFWGGINMRNALVSGRPCVKAMIRIQYADGSTSIVPTDESWQTTTGPIIRNSIFLGEHHDARAEKENWNTINANTTDWKNAVVVEGPKGTLSPQMQPPIRVTKIIKPVSVNEVKPGVFIFDMGQNFAGVARFRVKGPAGTEVKVRYGEDKYADGSLNVMTAVAGQIKGGNGGPGAPHIAWQEDSYILKGSGIEEWSP
ncbi:MAG: alpha-L-rhamnosidase, partial [Pedobacter sp.]